MRSDTLYLQDLIQAADDIAEFLKGVSRQQFDSSKLLQAGVLQKLTVIGEVASRLSVELRTKNSQIPWQNIKTLRNIVVHAYWGVDPEIVWNAATLEVAPLAQQIKMILQAQSP